MAGGMNVIALRLSRNFEFFNNTLSGKVILQTYRAIKPIQLYPNLTFIPLLDSLQSG